MKKISILLNAIIGYFAYAIAASCPDGKYGTNCSRDCHCYGDSCNPRTGICFSTYSCDYWTFGNCFRYCQGGWFGHSCNTENYARGKPVATSAGVGSYRYLDAVVDGRLDQTSRVLYPTGIRQEQWIQIHLDKTVAVECVLLYSRGYIADEQDYFEVTIGNQSRTFARQILCERKSFNSTGWVVFSCPRAISGVFVSVAHSRISKGTYYSKYWGIWELLVPPGNSSRLMWGPKVTGLQAEVSTVYNVFKIKVSWLPSTNEFNDTVVYEVKAYYYILTCPGEVDGKIPWVPFPQASKVFLDTEYEFSYSYFHTRYRIDVKPFVLPLAEGLLVSTISIDTPKARASKASLFPANLSASQIKSRSVLIKWTAPDCDKWRAPFASYTLTYGTTQRDIYNASADSYKITNLTPATKYTILLSFSTELETSFDASVAVTTSSEGNLQTQERQVRRRGVVLGKTNTHTIMCKITKILTVSQDIQHLRCTLRPVEKRNQDLYPKLMTNYKEQATRTLPKWTTCLQNTLRLPENTYLEATV